MASCEDKPCCVHGYEPCEPQWYDAPDAFDTSIPGQEHRLCDHENGDCDVDPEEGECEGDPDECPYGGCGECDDEYGLDMNPDHGSYIREDAGMALGSMEYDMGIEPRGWEDSY